jgi:hypothetical protein
MVSLSMVEVLLAAKLGKTNWTGKQDDCMTTLLPIKLV